MSDIIRIKDQFYILANSSLADLHNRVLKHSDTFAVFDRHGDIRPLGFEDHGLFHQGTRFISRFDLKFNGKSPLLLSSNVREDNDFLVVDLTNPDFESEGSGFVPRGTIHIVRTIFLWEAKYFERIKIVNFGLQAVRFSIIAEYEADYVDIFEVRGITRERRGRMLEASVEKDSVVLGYEGLDGVTRRSVIRFDPAPQHRAPDQAVFELTLDEHEERHLEIIVSCVLEGEELKGISLQEAFNINKQAYQDLRADVCSIDTSNEQFNDRINQSRADLHMLLTHTPRGLYPYAGIPWFSTVFGRDAIITALETLWIYPDIARGVLNYLADKQAREVIPEQDAEPGKILHEERKGEMAALREIPFGQYYGTIDATPLFIMLAGYYLERSGDRAFLKKLWPHIEAALGWIDRYGDSDGDGFVEYKTKVGGGLRNQGWKDSEDSIFHQDASLAEPPVALCEVQAYVYEAKERAADIAAALGDEETAARLKKEAKRLREKFIQAFWIADLGTYAIALDKDKRPCRVRSSNAGHCLFSGIADPSHAAAIIGGLTGKHFFSGWGIRTLASTEARYNPMSYHNGSIWPHDNAMIAFGMGRYGCKDAAQEVMKGLFDSSIFMELNRLPELFCGFERRPGEGPTLYPVACDPQAWAAGAVFMLLQACLGLTIHAGEGKIYFSKPSLPDFLREVHIRNLRIGASILDISFHRHVSDVGVNVRRKIGPVDVIATK